MQSELYCTVEDVARVYAVDIDTVRRWCRIGAIEGAIHAGRQWRIPKRYATGGIEIIVDDKERQRKGD